LAHRKLLLHFARPRPERLPFVEDGLEAHVRSTIQAVDSLLQPLMRPFRDGRGCRPFAPLTRALNPAAKVLARSLDDRRPTRRDPLPELRSNAFALPRSTDCRDFGVDAKP